MVKHRRRRKRCKGRKNDARTRGPQDNLGRSARHVFDILQRSGGLANIPIEKLCDCKSWQSISCPELDWSVVTSNPCELRPSLTDSMIACVCRR